MKKVFIKRGLKRMLSISLIVTMVLALPSVSVKKAKAANVTCPMCGAIGYGNHPSTNATCTEPAYEILYYSCNVHIALKRDLSKAYGSSYGPKGHDCYYESAANCVHGATYRCSRCDYVYYSGPLDYSKHTWVKTADATCTSAAIYRCSTCGDEVFRGSALAHDFYISASPTTEHGTEHTCRVCGNKYYDNDKITIFTLSFDASTNGGTSSERSTQLSSGTTFNLLGKTADKNGWEFVGWNTDRTAKTGLSSITMNDNKTLYAIFKKDLTVNFIDG